MSRDITAIPPVPANRRVHYGDEPAQYFDLYLPATQPVRGAAMMIHGGFWRARYDLLHASHLCAALAANGVAVANLEYRRVGEPGGGWPGTFHDVIAGFESVQKDLGSQVVVLGHSAGGHLALRLAVDRDPLGVVALAPVADLRRAYELNLSNGAVVEFLGGSPASAPDFYRDADAISHKSAVGRILLHGTQDDTVPIELSRNFVAARAGDPGEVQLRAIENTGHFEFIDPESLEWSVVLETVKAFLT